MNDSDKKLLIEILEKDHERENGFTLDECGLGEDCWYHKMIEEIKNWTPSKPKKK